MIHESLPTSEHRLAHEDSPPSPSNFQMAGNMSKLKRIDSLQIPQPHTQLYFASSSISFARSAQNVHLPLLPRICVRIDVYASYVLLRQLLFLKGPLLDVKSRLSIVAQPLDAIN
jgi:hypothetical protein